MNSRSQQNSDTSEEEGEYIEEEQASSEDQAREQLSRSHLVAQAHLEEGQPVANLQASQSSKSLRQGRHGAPLDQQQPKVSSNESSQASGRSSKPLPYVQRHSPVQDTPLDRKLAKLNIQTPAQTSVLSSNQAQQRSREAMSWDHGSFGQGHSSQWRIQQSSQPARPLPTTRQEGSQLAPTGAAGESTQHVLLPIIEQANDDDALTGEQIADGLEGLGDIREPKPRPHMLTEPRLPPLQHDYEHQAFQEHGLDSRNLQQTLQLYDDQEDDFNQQEQQLREQDLRQQQQLTQEQQLFERQMLQQQQHSQPRQSFTPHPPELSEQELSKQNQRSHWVNWQSQQSSQRNSASQSQASNEHEQVEQERRATRPPLASSEVNPVPRTQQQTQAFQPLRISSQLPSSGARPPFNPTFQAHSDFTVQRNPFLPNEQLTGASYTRRTQQTFSQQPVNYQNFNAGGGQNASEEQSVIPVVIRNEEDDDEMEEGATVESWAARGGGGVHGQGRYGQSGTDDSFDSEREERKTPLQQPEVRRQNDTQPAHQSALSQTFEYLSLVEQHQQDQVRSILSNLQPTEAELMRDLNHSVEEVMRQTDRDEVIKALRQVQTNLASLRDLDSQPEQMRTGYQANHSTGPSMYSQMPLSQPRNNLPSSRRGGSALEQVQENQLGREAAAAQPHRQQPSPVGAQTQRQPDSSQVARLSRNVQLYDLGALLPFAKSKHNLYNIFAIEHQIYLPPEEECTMDFLRDLLSGNKKCFHNRELMPIKVPNFEEFSFKAILDQIKANALFQTYLPDLQSMRRLSKVYLFNIVNSIDPSFFDSNIKHAYAQRKIHYGEKNQKQCAISSEMYDMIVNSNQIATGQRGRALGLLNCRAKRRSQIQRNPKRKFAVMTNIAPHGSSSNRQHQPPSQAQFQGPSSSRVPGASVGNAQRRVSESMQQPSTMPQSEQCYSQPVQSREQQQPSTTFRPFKRNDQSQSSQAQANQPQVTVLAQEGVASALQNLSSQASSVMPPPPPSTFANLRVSFQREAQADTQSRGQNSNVGASRSLQDDGQFQIPNPRNAASKKRPLEYRQASSQHAHTLSQSQMLSNSLQYSDAQLDLYLDQKSNVSRDPSAKRIRSNDPGHDETHYLLVGGRALPPERADTLNQSARSPAPVKEAINFVSDPSHDIGLLQDLESSQVLQRPTSATSPQHQVQRSLSFSEQSRIPVLERSQGSSALLELNRAKVNDGNKQRVEHNQTDATLMSSLI